MIADRPKGEVQVAGAGPRDILRMIERALFAAGSVLGVWAALTIAQGLYFKSLPVPAAATRLLPGEGLEAGCGASGRSSAARISIGEWVARLDAPSVALTATVLEGSDGKTLSRAAGHIEYTAFPGQGGNVGIAGHRDTTFRAVRNLRIGDPLILTVTNRLFEYRISETRIVNPEDVHVLNPTDRPTLTLVTCYPFTLIGNAPKRYIVRAELVDQKPR